MTGPTRSETPVGLPIRIGRAEDLDRAAVLAIARGARVELTDRLRTDLDRQRTLMLTALADGRAVYGVNTGMGALSEVRLTAAEQGNHQNHLLLARAVGGPPWLSRTEVRGLVTVRLRTFLAGEAAVSVKLLDRLVLFLNDDVLPAVPRSGYGTAGEIIALAHAFGPLIGIGSVRSGQVIEDAGSALRDRGRTPLSLGAKEGIALLQGVPGTTALALLMAERVRNLIRQTTSVVAVGLLATGAPLDPYRREMVRGDPELAVVTTQVCDLLADADADRVTGPGPLQAPVSFRVAGVVLAHLIRTVRDLEASVDRALAAVSDSPAFIDGEFRGGAGFYGLDLAAHLDALAAAVVHAAEVSAARTHRLLDTRGTGLSPQLAGRPGTETGLIAVHKRSAGVVHQLRRAANSSIVGTVETSFGQEDVQTFGWEAAENVRTAYEGAVEVLAGELLTAGQALALGGRKVTSGLRPAVAALWLVVEPIDRDRILGPDIEALRQLLATGGLSRADHRADP